MLLHIRKFFRNLRRVPRHRNPLVIASLNAFAETDIRITYASGNILVHRHKFKTRSGFDGSRRNSNRVFKFRCCQTHSPLPRTGHCLGAPPDDLRAVSQSQPHRHHLSEQRPVLRGAHGLSEPETIGCVTPELRSCRHLLRTPSRTRNGRGGVLFPCRTRNREGAKLEFQVASWKGSRF
jgi:hypothetical protein